MNKTVAFIQPYSLGDANGGARILRSLIKDAPAEVVSCNTSPWPVSRELVCRESHLPFRPHFGRIESTRFAWLSSLLDSFWLRAWLPKLQSWLERERVTHMHVVPHFGIDFIAAMRCARRLSLPLSLSVHDHPRYCFKSQALLRARLRAMGIAWRESSARFVISEPMGEAMGQEFGVRPWQAITDGVDTRPLPAKTGHSGEVTIYFMGLFHQSYRDNLRALLDALQQMKQRPGTPQFRVKLRCSLLPSGLVTGEDNVEVLPFASQETVIQDMAEADFLYLPLPFGDEHANFTRFSLSTKMVSYLGSGRPILLHAASDSAAAKLLIPENAAVHLTSNSPQHLVEDLINISRSPLAWNECVQNALQMGRTRFEIKQIRARFWSAVFEPPTL